MITPAPEVALECVVPHAQASIGARTVSHDRCLFSRCFDIMIFDRIKSYLRALHAQKRAQKRPYERKYGFH